MASILDSFVASEIDRLKKPFPEFGVGDTVVVKHKIRDEKGNERFQSMEGLCISIKNRGLGSAFTIRRTAHGVSMEKLFPRYSPLIESIALTKKARFAGLSCTICANALGRWLVLSKT